MALVTWALTFPLITAIVYFLGPTLARIPLVPRLAITTGIAVPVMTWILMRSHKRDRPQLASRHTGTAETLATISGRRSGVAIARQLVCDGRSLLFLHAPRDGKGADRRLTSTLHAGQYALEVSADFD